MKQLNYTQVTTTLSFLDLINFNVSYNCQLRQGFCALTCRWSGVFCTSYSQILHNLCFYINKITNALIKAFLNGLTPVIFLTGWLPWFLDKWCCCSWFVLWLGSLPFSVTTPSAMTRHTPRAPPRGFRVAPQRCVI